MEGGQVGDNPSTLLDERVTVASDGIREVDGETASILGVGSRHCKGELHEDDECGEEEHVGCVGCWVRWCLLYCPGADEDAVSWEDKTTEEGETPLLVKDSEQGEVMQVQRVFVQRSTLSWPLPGRQEQLTRSRPTRQPVTSILGSERIPTCTLGRYV